MTVQQLSRFPTRPLVPPAGRPMRTRAKTAPRKMPWREMALAASMWLAFIGLPIRAFGVDSETIRNGGRLAIDIGGMALVLVGLSTLRGVAGSRTGERYVPLAALMAASLLAAGTGLARGNALLLWTVMGVLPFLSQLVVLAVPADEQFENRLFSLLIWQTALGVVFATYVILFEPIYSRGAWNGANGDGLGKTAARCLYATPFLLACVSRLKPWQTLLAVTAWLELTLLGVLGASRGLMTVTFGLIPMSLAILALRTQARVARIVRPLIVACVVLGAIVGVAGATGRWPDLLPYFSDRWEQAVGRLTGSAPEDLTFQGAAAGTVDSAKREFLEGSSRGGELADFLAQMKPLDYIFGRGFGGTWTSSYWGQEWLIVHVGPGHLLLVGGLPLLLAFSWVLIGSGVTAWRTLVRKPIVAGAFTYILIFTEGFLQHGAIQDEIEVYFFWVCVGLTMAHAVPAAIKRPVVHPTRVVNASRAAV
jgi:hypothetical protein